MQSNQSAQQRADLGKKYVSADNQPTILAISSIWATNPTLANSDLTFAMPDSLSTSTEQQIGLISLLGFSGWNTLANVTSDKKNNIIKVTSTWYNRSINTNPSATRQSNTVTYTIPDRFYDITTLIALLNATTPSGIPTGDTTNQYTFGVPANVLYPGFTNASIYSPVTVNIYPANLVQAVAFANNTHVYESFELTCDASTVNASKYLGFQLNTNANIPRNTIKLFCVGYASNTNETSYTLSNSVDSVTTGAIAAPGSYNMNTTTSLSVSLENSLSQNRSTYYNLSKTDFMYRIPVGVSYGSNILWQATIDTPSYQTNFNLSEVRITIADQDSVNVNFQGAPWEVELKIDWAENADIPGNSAGELTMHNVNQRTFDPRMVNQGVGANYDRLFPERSSGEPIRKRRAAPF